MWAWARMLGGLGILAVLLWRLGTGAFLDGLRVIDARTLLAAGAIGLLTTVLSAWRWCLVARGLGLRLSLGGAVADYYRALFLNAALPGGVLGDVHRAVQHGRDVQDLGRGVRAVVLERSAGQVVLVAVGVGMLLVFPPPVLSTGQLDALARVGVVAVAAGALVAVSLATLRIRRRRRPERYGAAAPGRDAAFAGQPGQPARPGQPGQGSAPPEPPWPGRRPDSRLTRCLRTVATDVRLGLLSRRTCLGVVLTSAVILAGHLATFLVAARAAGSTAPVALLAPLMLLALLAMLLPLSVGGWGPREGMLAWAFGAAGLSADLGLTVAVVYGLLALVASLPGAGVLAYRGLRRLADARSGATRPVGLPPAGSGGSGDGERAGARPGPTGPGSGPAAPGLDPVEESEPNPALAPAGRPGRPAGGRAAPRSLRAWHRGQRPVGQASSNRSDKA
nr:lysylphosphatidylglycerol synthase transmembrane domain-containing protein [Micromonospora sp. DSM 115978]